MNITRWMCQCLKGDSRKGAENPASNNYTPWSDEGDLTLIASQDLQARRSFNSCLSAQPASPALQISDLSSPTVVWTDSSKIIFPASCPPLPTVLSLSVYMCVYIF